MLAGALAFSGQALALNPQPEPPIFYHGYELTITSAGQNEWRWEIRRPSIGHRLRFWIPDDQGQSYKGRHHGARRN